MVAGHLQEKNGLFYIVLSYQDQDGKRKQPWFPTGLPVKGNKKRAEKMLHEMRGGFQIPKEADKDYNILFADYLDEWVEIAKPRRGNRASMERSGFRAVHNNNPAYRYQLSAKTKSSLRTLPLVEQFKTFLLRIKEAQAVNKRICGNAYNYEYDGYIMVDELGNRMKSAYITSEFPKLLERNEMG